MSAACLRSSLVAGLLAFGSVPGMAWAQDCNEGCLLGIAGRYLDAVSANDPAAAPLSSSLRATENAVPVKPGEGIWKSATGWTYRHSFVDAAKGGIGVFGVVNEGPDKQALVSVRLKVADGKIIESETLVTRPGEFALFNPAVTEAKAVFTNFVIPDQRATRAQLEAIVRSYFIGITHADPSHVPFHPDCNRVENGVQTTNAGGRLSASCAEGLYHFAYMQRFRELRFPVIDTRRGLVWAALAFDMPEMNRTVTRHGKAFEINPQKQHLPRTLFLFELFKVEGGKIRAIEAFMRNMPIGSEMGWPGK